MANIFNTVLMKRPKRNRFNLSHDRKFSMDMGKLVPILVQEVIPGDTFQVRSEQMIRFAPLVAPVMHRIMVYTHYFFVPNRILWPSWEEFITGGEDGMSNPVAPYLSLDNSNHELEIGLLPDYFGLPQPFQFDPPVFPTPLKVSALPFAAYWRCHHEYYRDQNLQTGDIELYFEKWTLDDGDNTTNFIDEKRYIVPRRSWRHDYFTAALPFAQKGPQATIPIQGTADIFYEVDGTTAGGSVIRDNAGNPVADGELWTYDNLLHKSNPANPSEMTPVNVDNSQRLRVDMDSATATSINDLRRAFKLQEWLEKNARGGTRYIEQIFSHFGVKSSDARLQRPEYLGGGRANVSISEVLQMSQSDATPQGNLAGHGISVGSSNSFKRSFEEHGWIIGIMSVIPDAAYMQGISRAYTKFDKLDYFWPSFANIGEQAILCKELYYRADPDYDEKEFGYIPRYSEYRFNHSTVHGDFKKTLEYWHLARNFEDAPELNSDFIECNPSKRIFAVQDLPDDGDSSGSVRDYHSLYCHMFHQITAIRPIPKFGVPTI